MGIQIAGSLVYGCSKGNDKKCTDLKSDLTSGKPYCCARVELIEKGGDVFSQLGYSAKSDLGQWPKTEGPLGAIWACNPKEDLDAAVSNGYVLGTSAALNNKVKAYCDNATAVGASLIALATIFSASTF